MVRRTVPLTIEIDVEVDVLYTAGRPAPVSFGDHDSPGFSDPGDAPEIDLVAVRVRGDTNILPGMAASTEKMIEEMPRAFPPGMVKKLRALPTCSRCRGRIDLIAGPNYPQGPLAIKFVVDALRAEIARLKQGS